VGSPVMIGPPTWGVGPGATEGQVVMSVIRAAGGIDYSKLIPELWPRITCQLVNHKGCWLQPDLASTALG